jgi:hypothetical protein
LFKIRITHDKASRAPIPVYRAWIGDTQDGWEVYCNKEPDQAWTGPWTRDTAQEIADSMNRDDADERMATDGTPTAD